MDAVDEKGRTSHSKSNFTLYSLSDSKPAVESLQWVIPVKTKCSDGENAQILVGSSYNTYTLMDVYSGDVLVERRILKINSTNTKLNFEFKNSYQDKVTVQLLTVRNGKSERKSVVLERFLRKHLFSAGGQIKQARSERTHCGPCLSDGCLRLFSYSSLRMMLLSTRRRPRLSYTLVR